MIIVTVLTIANLSFIFYKIHSRPSCFFIVGYECY